MDQAEVQKQIDDALAKARAEWAKPARGVSCADPSRPIHRLPQCVRWLAMPLPNGAAR